MINECKADEARKSEDHCDKTAEHAADNAAAAHDDFGVMLFHKK